MLSLLPISYWCLCNLVIIYPVDFLTDVCDPAGLRLDKQTLCKCLVHNADTNVIQCNQQDQQHITDT